MHLLILGGTAFLGRAVATAALARGHHVTCGARGTQPAPDGAEFIRVDRDHPDTLHPVAARSWDAVVDVATQPGHARSAVQQMGAAHWVYVSSASVYAPPAPFETDESGAAVEPLAGDAMTDGAQYPQAKMACEEAVRTHRPSHTIVRAGLIGGDGDESSRSGYYPWRWAHPTGDDVLVPDDPATPVALIDVADLAAWLVACAEAGIHGTYNATGPTTTLDRALAEARAAAGATVEARPVPVDVLAHEGVRPWAGPRSFPLWIDDPDMRHLSTLNCDAARATGLATRPLRDTFAAALAFEERRGQPCRSGLTDDEERHLRSVLDGA